MEIAERVSGDRQAEAADALRPGAAAGDAGRVRARPGPVHARTGDVRGARPPRRRLHGRTLRRHVELLAGNPEAAESALRRGYDHLASVGERYLHSSVAGLLAEAVFIQGRWADAEALARETAELAAADDVDAQMLWRLQQARVSAARGEVADAERLRERRSSCWSLRTT